MQEQIPPSGERQMSARAEASPLTQAQVPLAIYGSTDLFAALGSNPDSGWEDSQARAGRVVFQTGNYFAAYSLDGGSTFTYVDPWSDLTGLPPGETFCCDQQVVYAPSIDRFIWIRQTMEASAGGNRYRISVASPRDVGFYRGGRWTSWDITPTTFGMGGHSPRWWFDFPHVSVGPTNFFLSFNVIGSGGAVLWRVPLRKLASGENLGGTPFLFEQCGGIRVAQNIGSRAWFACELSTSQIRSFFWDDASTGYAYRDINISTIPGRFTSIVPDTRRDWLLGSKIGTYILAATRAGNQVYYGWSAGIGNGFTQPHIEFVRINTNGNTLIAEEYIYNPDHTFVFPDFATNSLGEVGITFSWGGGRWAVHSGVGFLTSPRVFVNASPDGQASGAHYATIRRDYPDTRLFTVGNFFAPRVATTAGYANHAQFIVFGRAGL